MSNTFKHGDSVEVFVDGGWTTRTFLAYLTRSTLVAYENASGGVSAAQREKVRPRAMSSTEVVEWVFDNIVTVSGDRVVAERSSQEMPSGMLQRLHSLGLVS